MLFNKLTFNIYLLILLIAGCGDLFPQDNRIFLQDTVLAVKYFQTGDSLLKAAEFESSVSYFRKALDIYELIYTEQNPPFIAQKILECCNKIGWVLMKQSNFNEAEKILSDFLQKVIGILGEDNPEVAQTYNVMGVVNWSKTDYPAALEKYNKSLSIRKKIFGENSRLVASSYNNIGIIYEEMGNFEKALDYYKRTVEIDLISGTDELSIANTYNNIAVVYNDKGDYEKALEFNEKALSIRMQRLGENDPAVAGSYSSMGISYANMDDYKKALEYFKKAEIIYLNKLGNMHRSVGLLYNNISNCYYYLSDFEKALEYTKKSIKVKTGIVGEKSPALVTNYVILGKIYKDMGELDKAVEALELSVSIGEGSYGSKHSDIGTAYIRLAQVYEQKQDFDSALMYSQKAILSLVNTFNDESIYINPELEDINSEVELLNALSLKADLFNKREKSAKQDLEMSFKTYQLAVDLIDKMRIGYKTEGSKLALGERISQIYGNAIEVSLKLYNITGQENYRKEAFSFAEKSKAAVLMEGLSEVQAKEFGRIPSDLLEQEKEIKTELAFYETHLHKEILKKNEKDSVKINSYSSRLFDLKKNYEDLVTGFEKDYPEYYNLKYRTNTLTIDEIQKQLPGKTVLIEYFVGDSIIYVFTITKNAFDIYSVKKPVDFQELVKKFYSSILKSETSKYISSANRLSKLLIEDPQRKFNAVNKLIIIPHDILYKVPFEALFSMKQKETLKDYSKLAYLVKEYDISYHYSSELYINSLNKKQNIFADANNFIGFAPVFPEADSGRYTLASRGFDFTQDNENDVMRSVSTDGKNLNELKYSEWEVKSILELFKKNISSSGYFYSEATEEKFKSDSKDYNIIHIATHSFINELQPKISAILFAQPENQSNEDDGILYAGEIYNLDINSDLVVLSSCESGLGKIIRGEGMMALTRGFLYSGASNIIFSLWKIPDKHTSELMIEFYKTAFNKRETYSGALRRAKLALIKNSVTSRPRSWASFILIGSG